MSPPNRCSSAFGWKQGARIKSPYCALSIDDVNHLCSITSPFLLTSFTEKKGTKEGTPVVLMEAQACKKPCIATKHAGISEIVIDNHTGMLCKERDILDISKKMKLLYSDNSLRKKMGENALSHIKKNFNHEVQMKKLKRIYNSLINNYAK